MIDPSTRSRIRPLIILTVIWLVASFCDRLWFTLDQSVPAWDQSDYLTLSLKYWRELQHPLWGSGEWWTNFWKISSKLGPLTFILTTPWQTIFGLGIQQATLVLLFFNAILLGAVYGLGSILFTPQIALFSALFTTLIPGLYRLRLQFLLEIPVTTSVILCFFCLTLWKFSHESPSRSSYISWLYTLLFSLSFAGALLIKQTALLFLLTPFLWLVIRTIFEKAWLKLSQLILGFLLTLIMIFPWIRTNWLIIITAGKRATIDSAIAEGDPSLNTLKAWTYYWDKLPEQISWPLLIIPIIALIFYIIHQLHQGNSSIPILKTLPYLSSLKWLGIFWIGAYLFNSLNVNKDDRYVVPYLPIVVLFLSYCLSLIPRRWGTKIRGGVVAITICLTTLTLIPVGGIWGNQVREILAPGNSSHPYQGKPWPHREVIREIINTEPFLENTLAVIPSTPEVNQHNFNYFGQLENFQIFGREVGNNPEEIPLDVRSLSWFLTKTNRLGTFGSEDQQKLLIEELAKNQEFYLKRRWLLPDFSFLDLYQRTVPFVSVYPAKVPPDFVKLREILLPEKTPPGVPIPVNYKWSGSWEDLQSGIVLLTWRKPGENLTPSSSFIHDHGIGLGRLHSSSLNLEKSGEKIDLQKRVNFKVLERMSMITPPNLSPGNYILEATYLHRETGKTYPIEVPPITLTIDPNAPPAPSPELDLVTQLRLMALQLPSGVKGLENVFRQVGRINQYDPRQDYLLQTEKALEFRLKLEPNNLDYAYTLGLSQVLQEDVNGAITALTRVTQLDSQNPYAYAYLAFVYVYNWQGKNAQEVLEKALKLNPNSWEILGLHGVASLMRGNLIQAWHDWQKVRLLLPPKSEK